MTSSLRNKRRISAAIAMAGGLTLAGCALHGPAGPTVMALPARGESLTLFQQHDAACRQYASDQTVRQPANKGVAGAAIGTGVGAAAGALVGSASGHAGGGAAIGAGAGLLAGGLAGAISDRKARAGAQNRYDSAYAQCMVTMGEHVAQPTALAPVVYVPRPAGVVYAPAPVSTVPPPVR